jgi:MFS family permease
MLEVSKPSVARAAFSRRMIGYIALTFFLCLGSGMTEPVFSLHAQAVGASYRQVGLISAGASLIHVVSSSQMGRLGDVLGPEIMFLFAALAVVLCGAAYFSSTTLVVVTIGKAMDALFAASFWPAMQAASSNAAETAGYSMGIIHTVYPVTLVLASSLSGLLSGRLGYRASFAACFGAGVIAVAGVGLGWWTPSPFRAGVIGKARRSEAERCAPGVRPDHAERVQPKAAGGRVLGRRQAGFAVALAGCFIYCVVVGAVRVFLPLLGEARGISVEIVGLMVASHWALRTLTSFPAGAASERVGRMTVLVLAFAVGALGAVLMVRARSVAAMFAASAMMGVCVGGAAPVSVALAVDSTCPSSRGWAMGLCEAFCGLAFLTSGVIGGQLAGNAAPEAPFTGTAMAAGVAAVAIACVSWIQGTRRPR